MPEDQLQIYSFSKNVTAEERCILVHSTVLFKTKLRGCAGAMLLMLCFAILACRSEETPLGHVMAFRDLKHLTEIITILEKSIKHMSNTVDLTMVGNANIVEEIILWTHVVYYETQRTSDEENTCAL